MGGSLSEDFSKNRQRNQRFTYYEDVDKLTLNLSLSLSLVYFKWRIAHIADVTMQSIML